MAGLSVMCQNVSGSCLGGGAKGGKHCTFKVQCAQPKTSALILTETRIPERQYTGTGVFKGYKMTQHSSSGNRAGGVTIFTRKDLEVIPESVYGSPPGHFAIGCYDFHGTRVIIVGIYGVSAGSDTASMEVFEEFHTRLTETTTLYRTRTVII